jgi:hypothetical protein
MRREGWREEEVVEDGEKEDEAEKEEAEGLRDS